MTELLMYKLVLLPKTCVWSMNIHTHTHTHIIIWNILKMIGLLMYGLTLLP